MTGDVDAAVAAACRELIESSASLFAVQQFYGNKVREQTIKAYGRLRDAHLLIMAILSGALDRINGKIVPFGRRHRHE